MMFITRDDDCAISHQGRYESMCQRDLPVVKYDDSQVLYRESSYRAILQDSRQIALFLHLGQLDDKLPVGERQVSGISKIKGFLIIGCIFYSDADVPEAINLQFDTSSLYHDAI